MQSAYATLATGSGRVPVVLRNNTKDWLEIKKGTPIARMVAANLVPGSSTPSQPRTRSRLHLDGGGASGPAPGQVGLVRLEEWPTEQAEKARGLLKEYHDIFFLEKQDMGHTKAAEHKIVLKDPDTLQSRSVPQDSPWWPMWGGTPRPTPLHLSDAGVILVARYGPGPP